MHNLPENELIQKALTFWANHIETGKMHLSAEDLKYPNFKHLKANELQPQQVKLVSRLRQLAAAQASCIEDEKVFRNKQNKIKKES